MKTLPLLVLPALAAGLLPAAPASAATFGAARAEPCVQEVSARPDGTTWGAGACSGEAAVSRSRAGGPFVRVGGWDGDLRVLDVADDGTATFVALALPTVGSGEDVLVGKVPHGGRPSALTRVGGSEASADASLTASGGRWAVAWTEVVRDLDQPGSGRSTVKARGTLLQQGTQVFNEPQAHSPSLAFGPVLGATSDSRASGRPVPVLSLVFVSGAAEPLRSSRAVPGGRFSTTSGVAQNGGSPVAAPEVAVSGGTEVLAWSRAGRPALVLGREGVRRDLPARGPVQDLQLAASGGSAFVVTEERFSLEDAPTSRVYARDVTAGGVRSTTELPLGPKAGDAQVDLRDVTAAGGRAAVVTGDLATTRVSTSR